MGIIDDLAEALGTTAYTGGYSSGKRAVLKTARPGDRCGGPNPSPSAMW